MKEIRTVIAVATEAEKRLIRQERYAGAEIVVTGVGGTNVVERLKGFDRETTRIVNYGYVGSPDLAIGTEVQVGRCSLFHVNCGYDEPVYRIGDSEVVCRTSCDFVLQGRKGEVYDMELAFICALGFREVVSFKTVSDNCSYEEYVSTSGTTS